jgi:hypothetical protein
MLLYLAYVSRMPECSSQKRVKEVRIVKSRAACAARPFIPRHSRLGRVFAHGTYKMYKVELRAMPIQFALRYGLVVARRDNWCRGFTGLNVPAERSFPDLSSALAHIQADARPLKSANLLTDAGELFTIPQSAHLSGRKGPRLLPQEAVRLLPAPAWPGRTQQTTRKKKGDVRVNPSKRSFHKTIITITALTEGPYDPPSLDQVAYDAKYGDCSMKFTVEKSEEIDGPTMARLCLEQFSDPTLFDLTDQGEELDEAEEEGKGQDEPALAPEYRMVRFQQP